METITAIFTNTLAPIFGTLVTGLVSWGLVELAKFVRTRTKNEAITNAVSHVCETVEATVADLEQTMVPALKEAAADGKLTKEDREKLKRIAVDRVKQQVPAATAKTAGLAVNSLTGLIEAKIEKAVLDLKK